MAGERSPTTVGALISTSGGSIKTGPFGTVLKASEYTPDGVPLISVGEIGHGTFHIHSSTPRVPNEVTCRLPEYILQEGDIVFGRKGAVDRSARVSEAQAGWFLGSDGIRLRLPRTIDSKFMAYQLRSQESRNWIIQHATGTTMASLNQDVIARIPVLLPPLLEQRAIAHILGTLDDKIELNRRRNQTLEAMARALFKDWFVDFGPVRAKLEGREPYLPADLWQLFPDRLDDEGKPEGWVVGSVEELCSSITSGGTPARKKSIFWDGGTIPWFKTGELQDGPLLDSEEKITETALQESSCKLWPAGTILFALYASPTVGRLGVLTSPATSNQAAAGLIAKESIGVPFLRRALLEAREKLQNIAVGAAQQNINQTILKTHRLALPPACMCAHYSKLVRRWDDQQVQLAYETRTLAQLRDTLLPKLISGELRIPDAEKFMERAEHRTASQTRSVS
ncbi:MAG: restriction endonuclease subunit S [Lysobacterales bacterium]